MVVGFVEDDLGRHSADDPGSHSINTAAVGNVAPFLPELKGPGLVAWGLVDQKTWRSIGLASEPRVGLKVGLAL